MVATPEGGSGGSPSDESGGDARGGPEDNGVDDDGGDSDTKWGQVEKDPFLPRRLHPRPLGRFKLRLRRDVAAATCNGGRRGQRAAKSRGAAAPTGATTRQLLLVPVLTTTVVVGELRATEWKDSGRRHRGGRMDGVAATEWKDGALERCPRSLDRLS